MPTITKAQPRNESSSADIEPDHAKCYLRAIDDALAHALREVGATLTVPRKAAGDRADRVLAYFLDTMAGYAHGVIASHLLSGMRRWYGDDGAALVRAAMQGWPAYAPLSTEGSVVEQLYVRFCHVSAQARVLVEAVPERPMTPVMLSLLAKEDTIQRRLGEALALGWRVYCAAITTRRYPPLDRLWQSWVWQLDGKPVLTRTEIEEAGYIALVR